jgi:hypothetical protein
MKALLVLLLAAPLPARAQGDWQGDNPGQDRSKGPEEKVEKHDQDKGPGPGQEQGPPGKPVKETFQKQKFEEDPNLPKDQGWREIGLGGAPYGADPVPTLEAEDVRENVLTLLETHLARTGGRWVVADPKTRRERSLKLAELGPLTETKPGHYAGRARFRDAAGSVQAELVARVGGASWRILSLEPVGGKRPAAKKKPQAEPGDSVETMPADGPAADHTRPAPPPPPPSNRPPAWMSAPEPGR